MLPAILALVTGLDSSDLLKLLGLIAAGAALLLIGKRLGSESRSSFPAETPSISLPSSVGTETAAQAETEGPDPDQLEYTVPEDDGTPGPPPEHIRIEQWNFGKFDLEAGPPDRHAFADEVQMQLYDPSTGRRWMQTYFVATPAGLEKMLEDNKWSYMFIPQILILDRYDLHELQSAMLEEFGAVESQRGDVSPDAVS